MRAFSNSLYSFKVSMYNCIYCIYRSNIIELACIFLQKLILLSSVSRSHYAQLLYRAAQMKPVIYLDQFPMNIDVIIVHD